MAKKQGWQQAELSGNIVIAKPQPVHRDSPSELFFLGRRIRPFYPHIWQSLNVGCPLGESMTLGKKALFS